MRKVNHWTRGKRHFVLPPLPKDRKCEHGCRLCRGTFDSTVGEEVYIRFMEEPNFVAAYEQVSPFRLIAHTGLVPAPHGPVVFIVWQLAAGSAQETMVEQFIQTRHRRAPPHF